MIQITKLNPLREDDRGPAFPFSIRESHHVVALYRKKGSISGQHYHKGAIKSKDPEVLYLASGKMRLIVKDMNTGERQEYELDQFTKIVIPAMIYHEVHALTDIVLIEFNYKDEDFGSDTIRGKQ